MFAVRAISESSSGYLWSLLIDARSWPSWSSIDELVASQSSNLSPDGQDAVGAQRAFRTGKAVIREEIVELIPERRFAYVGVQNPVMSAYAAEILLRRVAHGTEVSWSGSYTIKPRMYPFFPGYLRRFMKNTVQGLANSERRAASREARASAEGHD